MEILILGDAKNELFRLFQVALNIRDALYGHFSFGLQKDSEFGQIFNYHLLKMQQSGILEGLHKKWLESPYGDEKLTVTTDEVNTMHGTLT